MKRIGRNRTKQAGYMKNIWRDAIISLTIWLALSLLTIVFSGGEFYLRWPVGLAVFLALRLKRVIR